MKIGLFSDTFFPEINGVATSCLNLERELTALGHEVHVFAPRCRGWETAAKPNFHYLTSVPFLMLKDRNIALPKFSALQDAVNLRLDVVHTNSEFSMGYFGLYVARHTGCALIHTYHTIWRDYTYYVTHGIADGAAQKMVEKYSEWWCEQFDRVIAPTEKTEKLLLEYGVDAPIDVIPTGIELSRFAPERHSAAEIGNTRRQCGVPEGSRVLLSIGRIAKEKNIEQTVRVFPRLLERIPNLYYVIVGEGPMTEELAALADGLGIGDRVRLVGPKPLSEIDKYYAAGDVFVSASHSETQGLTYIEAMSAGLCVCAVDDPCLHNVIEDGQSGILSGDSDDELLDALLRAFGDEGRAVALRAPEYAKPFSSVHFAKRIETCYENALSRLSGVR